MKQRRRRYFTEPEILAMRERWHAGESLNSIARDLDRGHSAVQGALARSGGLRPAQRRRSRWSLTLAEREEISRGFVAGRSIRCIASGRGRAPSTVSREVRRNGGRRRYRANQAEQAAWDRARRPKTCKLAQSRALASVVVRKLKLEWAPEQIAGWLKRKYPADQDMQVSHETIFKSLFIQARGALKKELLEHLRKSRAMRRSRHKTLKGEGLGQITNTVSIRERPANAEDRAVPGHWEGDLLFGGKNSQIATLVERQTRYVMLVRVPSRDSETVINALIKHAHKLPRELYKSLTWDRGSEMAAHPRFSLATDIKVYFCDPQHPWQRGSNENTNGLLRQYFPKGMDLSNVNQNRLNAVAKRLNDRPRKTMGYYSPAEKLAECIAATG